MKVYVRRDVGCNRDKDGKVRSIIVLFGRNPEFVIRQTLKNGWTDYTFDLSKDITRTWVQFDNKIVVGWIYDVPWYRLPQILVTRNRYKQFDLIVKLSK